MALDLNYEASILTSTEGMEEAEWLEWRRKGIFALGYLVIWGIIYFVIRKKTDKLNEGLKKIQQHGKI